MIKLIVALVVIAAAGFGIYWYITHPQPPDFAFAPAPAEGEPAADMAWVEANFPLSGDDLAKITPRNLQALTQEQVDQVYARLTAGPIPNGAFDGDLFFPRGANQSRFAEVVGGGFEGGLRERAANISVVKLEFLGARLWRGKVFDRETRILRNRITDLTALELILDDSEEDQLESLYDEDLGQVLLFPAKLYCGQSMLDGRRESIIIDYAYTDTLPGYLEKLDHLVGREGLRIRDEIRMVRPGFYLGRAYMDRVFVLNFSLYNEEIAESRGAGAEDCWTGEQQRVASARQSL
jgi:hypothetical protein